MDLNIRIEWLVNGALFRSVPEINQ